MGDLFTRILADPAVSMILTAILAAAVGLWLLAAMWAHGDAERRTESELAGLAAAAWILLSTPALLPLSLMAYVFVRPAEPVAERRVRELTAAFVVDALATDSCTRCGQLVDGSWRRCPSCATWLAEPCADCGRWSDAELDACPWCGATERVEPIIDEAPAFETGPFTTLPEPRVAALLPGIASLQLAGSAMADGQLSVEAERSASAPDRRPRPARLWGRRPQAPSRVRAPERAAERSRTGGGQGARPRS